ncbi:hypothetical protein KKA15_06050 [Patescibacteria group bacterium]|nr:hypothetical protein [Patescibacteria group bacterium]
MYTALKGGLTLAVLIIVVGVLLPLVGEKVVEIVIIILDLILDGLQQLSTQLPY